jgi:hypothetical protein
MVREKPQSVPVLSRYIIFAEQRQALGETAFAFQVKKSETDKRANRKQMSGFVVFAFYTYCSE